jgi:hypothetical protein
MHEDILIAMVANTGFDIVVFRRYSSSWLTLTQNCGENITCADSTTVFRERENWMMDCRKAVAPASLPFEKFTKKCAKHSKRTGETSKVTLLQKNNCSQADLTVYSIAIP